MPDLSLSLTYAPITGSITTDDVSSLMQRLEGAYQAAAVAPHVGLDRSHEVWARAERRQPTRSPIAEARLLIGEIEYLGRALAREEGGPSRFAYDIAIRQMLDELDRGRLAGGLQRGREHLEEQQHAWRTALDAAATAGTEGDAEVDAFVQLDGPFKLETGHLDQIRHGLRSDELDA